MASPTAAQVRTILNTTLSDEAIDAYVADAALLIESCLPAFNDARATSVLKWVTAHLITSAPANGGGARILNSKSFGDASETYQRGTVGTGLAGTLYGQQAIALDPTGCLANIGKAQICFRVL